MTEKILATYGDPQRPNVAVICMGSNAPDAAAQLRSAFGLLATFGVVCRCTVPYLTAPEKVKSAAQYTNQIVVLRTAHPHRSLHAMTKLYESRRRAASTVADTVAIDIDIVIFNDEILRPADYAASYFRQGVMEL